jgi:hypothetical protein
MRQMPVGKFLLLVAVASILVCLSLDVILQPPDPSDARLNIQRLKLLKSNLQRAGVLGPNREKSLSREIAKLEAWGY